jgi:hypothetical protein
MLEDTAFLRERDSVATQALRRFSYQDPTLLSFL